MLYKDGIPSMEVFLFNHTLNTLERHTPDGHRFFEAGLQLPHWE